MSTSRKSPRVLSHGAPSLLRKYILPGALVIDDEDTGMGSVLHTW